MFRLLIGIVIGFIIATVGVSGIGPLADRWVAYAKDALQQKK